MTDEMNSIQNSIGFLVACLSKTMERDFEQGLKSLKTTRGAFAVLSAIYHDEKKTPADLTAFIGVDGAAITRYIKNLEKLNLIDKRVSDIDKRSFELTLTTLGKQVVIQGRACSKATNEKFTKGLTKIETELFITLTNKMLANADRPAKRI
jgi:DNA-binding MarR family transcriptional regulator